MLIRVYPQVLPEWFWRGILILAAGVGFNSLLFVVVLAEQAPDLVVASLVLACALVSRFRWERFIPGEYLRESEGGSLARSRVAGLVVMLVALPMYFGALALI